MNKLVCFGEVLWDLFPEGPQAGGAPMNVAFHASALGMDVQVYSAVGDDPLGTDLLVQLRDCGISTASIQVHPHLPTGVVTVDTSDPSEVTYTIEAPVAWDEIAPDPQVFEDITAETWVVFGSLAARNATSRSTLHALLEQPGRKVFDMNLRAPFVDSKWILGQLPQVYLLKVNTEELEQLNRWLGLQGDGSNALTTYVYLQQHFGLHYLCLTRGGEGAQLFTPTGQFQSATYPTRVINTVGAGDSFLAALIVGLAHGQPYQAVMDRASALGALVAGSPGATPRITSAEIDAYMTANEQ